MGMMCSDGRSKLTQNMLEKTRRGMDLVCSDTTGTPTLKTMAIEAKL